MFRLVGILVIGFVLYVAYPLIFKWYEGDLSFHAAMHAIRVDLAKRIDDK